MHRSKSLQQEETAPGEGESEKGPEIVLCSFAQLSLSLALLASLADFDALTPFTVKDLVGTDPAAGVGVEDAVNDVTATSL